MSLESVVPTALIRQLQISLRDTYSFPSSDLSSEPSSTPAIQDAIASLDPALDPSARCGRCRGGLLLCGGELPSGLCVYCGERFKGGGEGAPPEISFKATNSYKWLLGSLGLDGSEIVNLDPEPAMPSKGRDPPKPRMILSDLLDLKLVFSPITTNGTNTELGPTTYGLNLSGIDLDTVFKETKKKETPQIKGTKNTQDSVPSSFAKWEADFGSEPVNPTIPVKVGVPASENLSESNLKNMVSETENHIDEAFDEWQAFDSKEVTSSGLDPNGLSGMGEESKPEPSPEDTLPIENREALNADGEDGLSGSVFKPEYGSPELVPVKNVESLNLGDDLFDEWKNFTGSGLGQSRLSGLEKSETSFWDPLSSKKIEESGNIETLNSDDWKNFSGSGENQIGLAGPEEKTQQSPPDPLTAETLDAELNDSFDDWKDFTGLPDNGSRDPLPVSTGEEPSDNTETLNADAVDSFDDWKDFTSLSAVESGLSDPREKNKPAIGNSSEIFNPLPVSTGEEPSDNTEALNAAAVDSFDDWKDFTGLSAVESGLSDPGEKNEPTIGNSSEIFNPLPVSTGEEQPSDNNTETLNADAVVESFDDWKDFTGLSDPGEKNKPAIENSSEIFNAWPVLNNSVPTNGKNTDLSDGWLDFMKPPIEKVTMNDKNEKESSDDWLAFTGVVGPTRTKSEKKLNLEMETPPIEGAVTMNDNEKESSDDWLAFTGVVGPTRTKSEKKLNLEKETATDDDLFDSWRDFTGLSHQSKKQNSNFGEFKHEDSSDYWLDFTGSGELKENSELKKAGNKNNSTSDGWLNFTGTNGVNGELKENTKDIDFGDFIQSSSFSAPTKHVNFNSSNGALADPLSLFSAPSNSTLDSNSNSNSNLNSQKAAKDSDIKKFLSQMNDLSFMLKDDLSIPDKPDSN